MALKIKNGLLISVEGIDGSGKSSLVETLFQELQNLNFSSIKTKEPGGTELGKYLRKLLQEREFQIVDKAEYLLFAADRAQHMASLIEPALKEGQIVISDRLSDSSLAYQGYGRGLDIDIINNVNNWALNYRKPDIIFYIKIDYETALNRIKLRNQHLTVIEQEKADFFNKVIIGFDKIFSNKSNVAIIDGTQTINKVQQDVIEYLKNYLSNKVTYE